MLHARVEMALTSSSCSVSSAGLFFDSGGCTAVAWAHSCSEWKAARAKQKRTSGKMNFLWVPERGWKMQLRGSTENLWKCFGVSFCLISLLYTACIQCVIKEGAPWYSSLLWRRNLILRSVLLHIRVNSVFCSAEAIEILPNSGYKWKNKESEGKPDLQWCRVCFVFSNTWFLKSSESAGNVNRKLSWRYQWQNLAN